MESNQWPHWLPIILKIVCICPFLSSGNLLFKVVFTHRPDSEWIQNPADILSPIIIFWVYPIQSNWLKEGNKFKECITSDKNLLIIFRSGIYCLIECHVIPNVIPALARKTTNSAVQAVTPSLLSLLYNHLDVAHAKSRYFNPIGSPIPVLSLWKAFCQRLSFIQ